MDETMKTEKSKVKLLKTIIIVLIIVILLLIEYICFDKFGDTDKCDTIKIENKDNSTNKNDDIPTLGSKKLEEIMEDYRRLYITDEELYKKESFNVYEISDYGLVITAINNLDDKYIAYCVAPGDELAEELSMEELNSALNGLVLNKSISIEKIKNASDDPSLTAAQYGFDFWGIVVNSNDTINVIGACGGPLGQFDYVDEKIIDVKVDGDKLFVYAKQAFVHYNDKGLLEFYKDYKHTTIIDSGIEDNQDVLYDDKGQNKIIKWDLYDTYKYTFKIVDGKYYFEQFNIEK